jgi:hypothetical protein
MNDILIPEIFDNLPVNAFFTGRDTNVDIKKIMSENIRCYLPIQKHTNIVIILDDVNAAAIEGDAVVTQKTNIIIGVRTADCVPILLYDRKNSVIAAVHAGWRGTALAILKNTISLMKDRFSTDPIDIIIAIGPSIKYCCFKVGQEVVDAVISATGSGDYYKNEQGDLYIDLAEANRLQALSEGVNNADIWTSSDCAYCNPDTYFSYRKSPRAAGRQGGFISIKT